jgi:hypothetical protein
MQSDICATEQGLPVIEETEAASVVMTDRSVGCPHKVGIDHEGQACPVFST